MGFEYIGAQYMPDRSILVNTYIIIYSHSSFSLFLCPFFSYDFVLTTAMSVSVPVRFLHMLVSVCTSNTTCEMYVNLIYTRCSRRKDEPTNVLFYSYLPSSSTFVCGLGCTRNAVLSVSMCVSRAPVSSRCGVHFIDSRDTLYLVRRSIPNRKHAVNSTTRPRQRQRRQHEAKPSSA